MCTISLHLASYVFQLDHLHSMSKQINVSLNPLLHQNMLYSSICIFHVHHLAFCPILFYLIINKKYFTAHGNVETFSNVRQKFSAIVFLTHGPRWLARCVRFAVHSGGKER